MKIAVSLFFVVYMSVSYAVPKHVEIWFLSRDYFSNIKQTMKNSSTEVISDLKLSTNIDAECIPMGAGCFHPQLGFIEKEEKNKKNERRKLEQKEIQLKTFNSLEVDKVDCDSDNYFDIYCGKSRNRKGIPFVEIWIDVSSSFRSVDYSRELGFCKRRSFIVDILNKCPLNSVEVSIFNTSIKMMGSFSSLCLSSGMNDNKRLIRWIKSSAAKKLLIITDVDEMSNELSDFLLSINAKIRGIGTKTIMASDLPKRVSEILKICKKK